MVEYLFVYGTLRRCSNSPVKTQVEERCRYLGDARMQGRLYDMMKGYPGATLSSVPSDAVHGDLLEIGSDAHDLFAILDEYEECAPHFPPPHEYIRSRVVVTASTGVAVEAWTYLYNGDVSGLRRIVSGDFVGDVSFHI